MVCGHGWSIWSCGIISLQLAFHRWFGLERLSPAGLASDALAPLPATSDVREHVRLTYRRSNLVELSVELSSESGFTNQSTDLRSHRV